MLWASFAIRQYLADTAATQMVYPAEPRARADVNRWLFWCGQHFMPGLGILNRDNAIKTWVDTGR